ncbi:3-hydroxyisobutyrate dehydrogenase [Brevibacterium epidermidis]|jgi:3-hydroxyisobutyrate dehydrogenase|uniref:3-hydroxyisobutyrate dehydrogenase n=1 Tax=Brevibacterium epidermidis TaxID=1698 RepID=A0ABV4ELH1_BREEP
MSSTISHSNVSDGSPAHVTVIGLGEAGSIYARAFAEAGCTVIGADPVAPETPEGVLRADDSASAVAEADLVLVLTHARAARSVAAEVLPAMKPGSIYADMTSSQPRAKRALTEFSGSDRVRIVDVAVLGAVSSLQARTPLMVSGAAAGHAADLLRIIGAPVENIGERIGAAMDHKLIRSVFSKGIASLTIEAIEAGRAAGIEKWVREEIGSYLSGDAEAVQAKIDRWLTSTPKHAARRSAEMRDVSELLKSLAVSDDMTAASATQMEAMLSQKVES